MTDPGTLFLDDIVLGIAGSNPNKTALVYEEQSLTYSELSMRVQALSKGLLDQGVQAGDFVATLIKPGLAITPMLLAIIRVGAIYTPLDPSHPLPQLQERLDDVEAKLIVTDEHCQNLASELNTTYNTTDQLLFQGSISRTANELPARSLDDPACIFFTSGTTGKAKGVLGSARAMRDSILEPTEHLEISADDQLNSIARYAWSISMLEMLAPLVVGGTSLILDRDAALNFDELKIKLATLTAFHAPPALLKLFATHMESIYPYSTELGHIRLVWYGGDKLSPASLALIQKVFPNAKVGTAYGCTEIFGLSHCYFYSREEPLDKVFIGKPVGNMSQQLVADGSSNNEGTSEGEIYLGGQRLALEYWKQDQLTSESFKDIDGQRYYATGDFAKLDDKGNLEFSERRDSQIKIRGIRIELGEIEHSISQHQMVKEVVVLAKDIDDENKEIAAFVILNENAPAGIDELRKDLKAEMPDYLLPSELLEVNEFPLTENFKVDRKALLELSNSTSTEESGSIEGGIAGKVAEIWKNSANVEPNSIDENFFDIGGNSLNSALLAVALSKEFQLDFQVADIYKLPTIAQQLEKLASQTTAAPEPKNDQTQPFAAFGQRGIFFRELFEKSPYSITCTRHIQSANGFNEELVKQALLQLAEQLEVLRTGPRLRQGEILLDTANSVSEEDIQVNRVSGRWSVEGGEHPRLAKQDFKFDLRGKKPLISAAIFSLENEEDVLQITVHHFAADDNSTGRIAHLFLALYGAMLNGEEAPTPDFQNQFMEFASKQRAHVDQGDYNDLADTTGGLMLENYQRSLAKPIMALSPQEGSTGFEYLSVESTPAIQRRKFVEYIAALSLAMHKKFGRNQFVFCAHVALQRDSESAPKVGMYVNLLPLVVDVKGDSSTEQHIASTQRSFDDAMGRSDVPYELILSRSEELRRLGSYPFDAFVNELDFSDTYPEGYTPVVRPGKLSSGDSGITMTVSHLPNGESINFETTRLLSNKALLEEIADEVKEFLESL